MELQELIERIERWKQRAGASAERYAAAAFEAPAEEEMYSEEADSGELMETVASERGVLDFEEMEEVTELSSDDSGIIQVEEAERS